MLNNTNFHKSKNKEQIDNIDFFSHTRRVPLPDEKEVGIEDYNSKANGRVPREQEERHSKDEEEEDKNYKEESTPFEEEDPELHIPGTNRQHIGAVQRSQL